ncbi:MAG: tetratricopeptide repeat protein [Kiritimatiellales bacterium]|nr:tetratricopeptide repeat protein [Kiritimatiellales bacterium]
MKKKDELRDIYQGDNTDFEKDFTPQVAQEIIEQRQRDLLRSRVISLFFGGLAVLLAVALIAVAIRDFLSKRSLRETVRSPESVYIPQHSLPSEAAWVMDYRQAADDSQFSDEPGEKPLSTKWVKKAAYHIIMGQQALAIDEPEEALRNFQEVVKIYPDIEGLHRSMGMLYIQEEQYELAAQHLELALEEEELFDVVNNLGTAYIGTKNYELAEKHLTRALELQPESPISHKNLAVLYRKMDRADDAVFHFEKYLDLRPDDLETMQTYALYLTKLGRWETAAEFLTDLTQEVTDVAPIYFLLAQVQVQNGEEAKAMAALQRGIQLVDPSLALAWMTRDDFNMIRESQDFQSLVDQLEIASVSLDGRD